MGDLTQSIVKPVYTRYYFSLLLAILTVTLIHVAFGFYWEDSMKIHPNVIYGNISAPPYKVWLNEALLFQIPLLAYLSSWLPNIPVVGIWFLAIITVYVSLWFYLSIRVLSRQTGNKPWAIILWSHLIVWSVLGIALGYVNFTRDSILLVTVSILLYFDYYLFEHKKSNLLILLFGLGCTMRLSSSAMALVALTFLCLLHFRSWRKTLSLLTFHWLFLIFCLVLMQGYKFTSQNPALAIEQQSEYALADRGAVVSLTKMKTKEDSIRYLALTHYFLITDSAQINLSFINRVVDNNAYMKFAVNRDDLLHLTDALMPLLNKNKVILLPLYLLLLVLAWNCSKRTNFNVLVFNLVGWSAVICLTMKISMYDRFLLPWFSMLIACSIWLCISGRTTLSSWQKTLSFVLSIGMIGIVFLMLNNIKKEEQAYNQNAYAYLNNLKKYSDSKVPVIWDYKQVCFPTEIFSRNQLVIFKKCLYQSMFFIMYYEFGQERCKENFGFSPLDWKRMNIYFNKHPDTFCFVVEDNFAQFIEEYYSTIYHLHFKLKKAIPANEIYPHNYVFHLEAKPIP